MIANGPDTTPESSDGRATLGAGRVATPMESPGWLKRARWLAALAGVLAGLISFGVGEAIYKLIPAQLMRVPASGGFVIAPTAATQAVADTRNAALAFGVLGSSLGGCLGIAGGLARRSGFGSIAAGLFGAMLGAALPAGISMASIIPFANAQIHYSEYDLFISMAMHGLIWGLAGAAAGLAFAFGLGRPRLCVGAATAGLVGAVIGAVAFRTDRGRVFPPCRNGRADLDDLAFPSDSPAPRLRHDCCPGHSHLACTPFRRRRRTFFYDQSERTRLRGLVIGHSGYGSSAQDPRPLSALGRAGYH